MGRGQLRILATATEPGRGHQSGRGSSPESSRRKGSFCCPETQPTRGLAAWRAAPSRVLGSALEVRSDPRAKGLGSFFR